jgi:hypothetical protein
MMPPQKPRQRYYDECKTNRARRHWYCDTCEADLGVQRRLSAERPKYLYILDAIAIRRDEHEEELWHITCIHGHVTQWRGHGVDWRRDFDRNMRAA